MIYKFIAYLPKETSIQLLVFFVWILKYDLYDLILSKREYGFTFPHVACMTIGLKKRNLDGTLKNIRDKYLVCVRSNFIRKDILNFKNSKKLFWGYFFGHCINKHRINRCEFFKEQVTGFEPAS